MSVLPVGWAETTLNEVTDDCLQKVPAEDETFLYVDIASVDREKKLISSPQQLLGKDAPSRARKLIDEGDVLVSMTRPNLNAVAIVPNVLSGHIASTGFDVLRAATIDPRWVFYTVRSTRFIERMEELVQGALYPAVRGKDIRSYEIPLAPLPEQKRIADKLDSVLARVDACRDRLDRLPALLKRFRRSILDAATSGRLTKDWRNQPDTSITDNPTTPASWTICKIKDAGKIQLGRQRSPKYHSGENMRPYLRVQNVFEDRLDLSDVMSMDFPGEDFERYQLHPGDILLNEGQSPEYLGRPAMYRGELPGACFTNTLIRFQAYSHVKAEYALMVFRNHMHSGRYITEGTITTNIAHLGAGRFSEVEFPLPPQEEQTEIVRRVEILFAFADRLDARLATARKQVGQLTPALLAKAFRGELVAQDPADEPAAELLKRLAAQREAAPKAKRGRAKA